MAADGVGCSTGLRGHTKVAAAACVLLHGSSNGRSALAAWPIRAEYREFVTDHHRPRPTAHSTSYM